jgi:hypothetical protein
VLSVFVLLSIVRSQSLEVSKIKKNKKNIEKCWSSTARTARFSKKSPWSVFFRGEMSVTKQHKTKEHMKYSYMYVYTRMIFAAVLSPAIKIFHRHLAYYINPCLIPTFRLVYIDVIFFNHLCFINVRMCLFLCSAHIELGF